MRTLRVFTEETDVRDVSNQYNFVMRRRFHFYYLGRSIRYGYLSNSIDGVDVVQADRLMPLVLVFD